MGPDARGGVCSKEDKAMVLLTPWGEHTQELGQKRQVSHWQKLPCQCQQGVEVANLGVLTCAPPARHSLHLSPGRDGEKHFLPAGNPETGTSFCTLTQEGIQPVLQNQVFQGVSYPYLGIYGG